MFPSPPSLTKTERLARKVRIPRWEYWTPGSARRRLDFDESLTVVTSSQSSPDLVPALEGDLLGTISWVEMTPTMVVMQQEEEPESVISEAEDDAEDKTGSDEDNYLDGDDTEDSDDDGDDLDSEAPNVVHHLEEHYDLRPRRNNEWFGMSDEDRNANQELVNGILEESNRDEKVSGAAHSLLQRVSETFVTTVFKDSWERRSDDTVRKGDVTTAAKLGEKRKRMGSEVEQLDRKKH
ncbi:hypothetical protein CAEBREN_02962 [Caenorhabditis brenneri]|uniref:Uncharacterized protein n=1 Tax=Caenorhabditis brenneri TaxID=135651 RepID=G0MM16_CAEBE|nr:hypothetical protein CAEBREN_02962 [Caenorhabditis brenneri]